MGFIFSSKILVNFMAWVADLDADGQVEADVLEEAAGPVEAATCCPCSSLGPCFLQA